MILLQMVQWMTGVAASQGSRAHMGSLTQTLSRA